MSSGAGITSPARPQPETGCDRRPDLCIDPASAVCIAASSGDDLVGGKSALLQRLKRLPPLSLIMIIDDSSQDAGHISATLNLLLGRETVISHYRNMAVAIDSFKGGRPQLVFLDDYLPPLDRAESSMRSLRRFGFEGPVVVMSGMITRSRRAELSKLGLLAILHKDDINTFSLAEVLVRMVPDGGGGPSLDS